MARSPESVDVQRAAKLMQDGALMVDVRETYEYARGQIPGSQNVALSAFETAELPVKPGQAVVFFCASGNRTNMHAARLAAKAGSVKAYVMQGGIGAWSRAGLPVEAGGGNGQGESGGFFTRLFAR